MYKHFIVLVTFWIGFQTINAQSSESQSLTLFAQGMFSTEDADATATIESTLSANPNISIVRLDNSSGRFLVLTQNISTLTESQVRSWFGELGESLTCIQIGVHGVDKRNSFPFTECND